MEGSNQPGRAGFGEKESVVEGSNELAGAMRGGGEQSEVKGVAIRCGGEQSKVKRCIKG